MVAESGAVLLDDAARAALVELLIPRATVITPNLPEARVLARHPRPTTPRSSPAQLHRLGPHAVVVTGGHRDEVTDVFYDGTTLETLSGPRHPDGAAHGSGCTHSSALAAHLALGDDPLTAARHARDIASEAVDDGLRELGHGAGPGGRVRPPAPLPSWRAGGESACNASGIIGLDEVPAHAAGPRRAADRRGRRLPSSEDEERLIEMFRRQLDDGMWAAVPTTTETGRRQAEMVRAFEEIPRDTDRVIFFPRAAGGAR